MGKDAVGGWPFEKIFLDFLVPECVWSVFELVETSRKRLIRLFDD